MKKSSEIILVTLLLILIIIMGVGGWFLYDSLNKSNNKIKELETKLNSSAENNSEVKEEDNNEKNVSLKVDETKDWVYNVAVNEKTVTIGDKTLRLSEHFNLPKININSASAQKANQDIQNNIYKQLVEKFGTEINSDSYYLTEMDYKYTVKGDILSLIISYGESVVPGGGNSLLKTYNFNIKTGNLATFDEISEACGFSSSVAKNKITEWNDKSLNDPSNGEAATFVGVTEEYFINKYSELLVVYKIKGSGNHMYLYNINNSSYDNSLN